MLIVNSKMSNNTTHIMLILYLIVCGFCEFHGNLRGRTFLRKVVRLRLKYDGTRAETRFPLSA